MATESQIQVIESIVKELIAGEPALFLVEIKVKPSNNIQIFLDGDEGVTIEKCIRVNRALYRKIEEDQILPPEDFSLEVSSPGVGEPLLLHRQYVKNIGRLVEVKTKDGLEITGDLKEISETEVVIETTSGKGKKIQTAQQQIAFDNIKSTTVQIKF